MYYIHTRIDITKPFVPECDISDSNEEKTHVVVVVVAAFFDSRDDDDVELSGRYYYHNNKILTVSLGINITTSYTLSITNKNGDDYDDGEDKFLGKILY